jgi:hypothetical protein
MTQVFLYFTAESALKSFLSGGVGGICVVLVGHPFDLVKVCDFALGFVFGSEFVSCSI